MGAAICNVVRYILWNRPQFTYFLLEIVLKQLFIWAAYWPSPVWRPRNILTAIRIWSVYGVGIQEKCEKRMGNKFGIQDLKKIIMRILESGVKYDGKFSILYIWRYYGNVKDEAPIIVLRFGQTVFPLNTFNEDMIYNFWSWINKIADILWTKNWEVIKKRKYFALWTLVRTIPLQWIKTLTVRPFISYWFFIHWPSLFTNKGPKCIITDLINRSCMSCHPQISKSCCCSFQVILPLPCKL